MKINFVNGLIDMIDKKNLLIHKFVRLLFSLYV